MNPDTGHLIEVGGLKLHQLEGYEQLPEGLQRAAKQVLASRSEAHVSLTSGGKLSRWAAKRRKERKDVAKRRKKRKTGARSKKRNRGK